MHMPGGLEEMPLPRPRNIKRLSSLQPADVDGASTPMSSRSIFSVLNRLSPMSKMSSLSKHSSQGQDRLSSDFSAHRNGTDGTFRQSGDAAEGEWCYASSGGKGVAAASAATDGAGRALNAVTHTAAGLKNRAVQEAQDAAEVFGHRSEDSAKSKRRPFGRNSVGSDSSLPRANSGHWTLWHMFGCVTVQSNFRAESSSSDDDDDDDERVHVQAA